MDEDDDMSADKEELRFTYESSTLDFNLQTNGDWVIRSHPAWCTVNTQKGNGNQLIKVTVQENNGSHERKGYLNIIGGNGDYLNFPISQEMNKEEDVISLSQPEILFTSKGGYKLVDLKANGRWNIASTIPDWFTLNMREGISNTTLYITAEQNKNSQPREAYILFKRGDAQVILAIKQEKTESSFSLKDSKLIFSSDGGQQKTRITSNDVWSVANNLPYWCKVTPSYGQSNSEVTVTVDSYTGADRSCEVIFICGSSTAKLIIEQRGETSLRLSQSNVSFTAEGGRSTIQIETNSSWNINLDNVPSFCRISPASGNSSGELTIEMDENPNRGQRSLTLYVVSGNARELLYIRQAGR